MGGITNHTSSHKENKTTNKQAKNHTSPKHQWEKAGAGLGGRRICTRVVIKYFKTQQRLKETKVLMMLIQEEKTGNKKLFW